MYKHPTNGIIQFAVNGTIIGTTKYDDNLNSTITPNRYDQYNPSTIHYSPTLNPIKLNPGPNTITITTTGKNTKSTGYGFAIDQIRLIKQ